MRSNHHAVILAASLALGLWLTPARASDLTVGAMSGQVTVIERGHSVPVSVGAKLTLPVEIHTGSDGAIDLQQLGSTLHLGPNATIVLPEARDNAVDRVKQSTGSVLYNIKSRKDHPLAVETPYLVSVVKGTLFTVEVEERAATVALMEGSLDISAPGVANHVLLKPNQSIRHAEGDPQLTVQSAGPAAAVPRNRLRTDPPFALPDTVQSGQMAQVARDLADAGAAVAAGHVVAMRESPTTAATSSGMPSPATPGAPSSTGEAGSATSNTSSGPAASNTSSGSAASNTSSGLAASNTSSGSAASNTPSGPSSSPTAGGSSSPTSPGSSTGSASSSGSSGTSGSSSSSGGASGSASQGSSSNQGSSSSSGTSPPVTLPSSGDAGGSTSGGNCNGKNNGTGNGNCYGHQPKQALKQ